MARLKSKRYLLAAIFALAAFGATFAAVLAGVIPVQWSREQPATVVGVAMQVLPPDSMTLFRNAGLTDQLNPADALQFAVPLLLPPLNVEGAKLSNPTVRLWLRNDSDVPLSPVEIFDPSVPILDSQTGQVVGGYEVFKDECCSPILPGQALRIRIELGGNAQRLVGQQFTVVIGSVGEQPTPLTAHVSSGDFLANVGSVSEIDFESLPHNADSCPESPLFAPDLTNPLVIQGVTFRDPVGCLGTGFNAPLNDNLLFISSGPGRGVIELPLDAFGNPKSNGALLVIRGMGPDENFQVRATDGNLDTLAIDGTGDGDNLVFAGFTSGQGIKKIEVPLATFAFVLSSFTFETPAP